MTKQIRIIPKRRDVDVERLAVALLDMVAGLSEEERQRFAAEGGRVLEKVKGGKRPRKESAA